MSRMRATDERVRPCKERVGARRTLPRLPLTAVLVRTAGSVVARRAVGGNGRCGHLLGSSPGIDQGVAARAHAPHPYRSSPELAGARRSSPELAGARRKLCTVTVSGTRAFPPDRGAQQETARSASQDTRPA